MRNAKSKEKEQPIILITNDDGITAPGIRRFDRSGTTSWKATVVAPDKPQSGMGHAVTIGHPLRLHVAHQFGDIEATNAAAHLSIALNWPLTKCCTASLIFCLSGINHGANHSINVIYSGTMSAALEASIESIPSIGFSLLDHSIEADFAAQKYAAILVEHILQNELRQTSLPEC